MPKRTRAGVLVALAAAGLAAGTALAQPAGAATKAPGFLTAADLPPHLTSSWTAGKVTAGLPETVEADRCLGKVLNDDRGSWHREFRTDLDAHAVQVSVESSTTGAAKGRVARLDKDIRSCAARTEKADPDLKVTFKDYGTLPVEEGAHLYGLHTETSYGATDVRLLAVGRDGRTVTVVDWGRMGGFKDAPVKAFKKTATKAVEKLH
ncbi:hypothetical protein [Streptomyces sp. CdTB01]|uniref:hypothetical protein n=1 Tax=Streptomyces sp. CdTB01 TaxID=1725411 RepID=UPI00073AC558|nr:hypothetical protein [Streptomyces sp. CdTB01]ALV32610.1 hypothetical protein AS200_11535 [Streptomyces sp. CdTB01]